MLEQMTLLGAMRIHTLACFVLSLRHEQFDFSIYRRSDDCGTAACLAGWMPECFGLPEEEFFAPDGNWNYTSSKISAYLGFNIEEEKTHRIWARLFVFGGPILLDKLSTTDSVCQNAFQIIEKERNWKIIPLINNGFHMKVGGLSEKSWECSSAVRARCS